MRRKQELTTGVSLHSESRRIERKDKSRLMSRRCVGWVGFFFPIFSFPALNLVPRPPWSHAGPFTSHSKATHSNDSDDYFAQGEAGPPVRTSPHLTLSGRHERNWTGAGSREYSLNATAAQPVGGQGQRPPPRRHRM